MPNLEEPQYDPFRAYLDDPAIRRLLNIIDVGTGPAAPRALRLLIDMTHELVHPVSEAVPGSFVREGGFRRARNAALAAWLYSMSPSEVSERFVAVASRPKFNLIPSDLTAIPPSWLTTAVVGLAESMWDADRFEQMPVLADALEEAGCQ